MNTSTSTAGRWLAGASFLALLIAAPAGCSSGGNDAPQSVGQQCDAIGAALCQRLMTDCVPSTTPSGQTVGDQCKALAGLVCPQLVTCGAETDAESCAAHVQTGCCEKSGTCGVAAASDASSFQPCGAAMTQASCSALAAGTLPAACKGLVRMQPGPEATAACESQAKDACCATNGVCDRTATSASSAIDTCVQSVKAMACNASDTPLSCKGVITASFGTHVVSAPPGSEGRAGEARPGRARELGEGMVERLTAPARGFAQLREVVTQ